MLPLAFPDEMDNGRVITGDNVKWFALYSSSACVLRKLSVLKEEKQTNKNKLRGP
jgi:hypothetical protein